MFVLLAGTALVSSWETVSAQGFEAVGTRALGMGGAFVADDASAVYWNPAGLATGAFLSLVADTNRSETRLNRSESETAAVDESGLLLGFLTSTSGFSYYRLRSNQIAWPFSASLLAAGVREDLGGEHGCAVADYSQRRSHRRVYGCSRFQPRYDRAVYAGIRRICYR